MKHTIRTHCRVCPPTQGSLAPFADLGRHPLADRFLGTASEVEPVYPLRVAVCSHCTLVQHTDIVADTQLFGEDYAFFTGASPSSIAYFADYAADTMARFPDKLAFIIEIASNDGTLLTHFQQAGHRVLGIEPAGSVAAVANEQGVPTRQELFTLATARAVKRSQGQAPLIVANNVVAHTDTLIDFLSGVWELLAADGVFICEVQYLPHLLFANAFDHLYHEHRSFFSLRSLTHAFARVGLTVFDVTEADTQGGSIRVFARRSGDGGEPVSEAVGAMLDQETALGLDRLETYQGFAQRAAYVKSTLLRLLRSVKAQGNSIQGFGASAKGNTLLNYCGIGTDLIDCIVDLTPYKIGRFAPGSRIPVKHPGDVPTPDYYLVLVWNYLEGILRRETAYRATGGRFIVPIPGVIVV